MGNAGNLDDYIFNSYSEYSLKQALKREVHGIDSGLIVKRWQNLSAHYKRLETKIRREKGAIMDLRKQLSEHEGEREQYREERGLREFEIREADFLSKIERHRNMQKAKEEEKSEFDKNYMTEMEHVYSEGLFDKKAILFRLITPGKFRIGETLLMAESIRSHSSIMSLEEFFNLPSLTSDDKRLILRAQTKEGEFRVPIPSELLNGRLEYLESEVREIKEFLGERKKRYGDKVN